VEKADGFYRFHSQEDGNAWSSWRESMHLSTYSLHHKQVNEDEERRITLHRYIVNLFEAGERDPVALLRAGTMYLRKLHVFSEQRDEPIFSSYKSYKTAKKF
jgi:hypothetical protein